ncbi:HTH-type transcriptional regulator MalT [Cupriavidus yeoncheonensis]|uniref:HTH-type transcriptional regulator MalT n=1 Tax=Cupriavidus yeoncheonensis TaxID=1462994 RepID=A0A916IT82_9BURK|nr:LuxR C-terminal-related transcriptional regulator [Cupriavidus yeoncheonensis]CAG2143992.1 HTH-type transcriptional regulator MalT [Cupriavidus yeoncheonensis]
MRVAAEVVLSAGEREALGALADASADPRLVQRARIVLLAAQGMPNKDIADELGLGRAQVSRWRERFVQSRLAGIEHNLPRGAPPVKIDLVRLAELTAQGRPDSPEPWSTRRLADVLGVSAATISRHWSAVQAGDRGLAPADLPDLSGRRIEIVGVYVRGGEHALVLASGGAGARPPASDDTGARRVGMTALLDALKTLGNPEADEPADQAHWLAFLRGVERAAPDDAALHVLCDNYATHQRPPVRRWLARHPRIQAHFPGASASWLRMVQRWLRAMDTATLRHAMQAGPAIVAAIADHGERREGGRPFLWLSSRFAVRGQASGAPDSMGASVRVPDLEAAPANAVPPRAISIEPAKLAPPRPSHLLFARDALMSRLQDARRQRCILLQAAAGSGKTGTLLAWRRLLLGLDYDVAWLTLSHDDNSPSRFLDSLSAALAQTVPAVDDPTLWPDPVGADALEHRVIRLVQALAQHPHDLVLMLDDLRHIDDPDVFRVLQWLLDYAPPNLHLALAARTAPPLSLTRLQARGLATEIGMSDLRFSAEETEAYLAEQAEGALPGDAAEIHRLTAGWVTGLRIIASEMPGRRHPGWRDAKAHAIDAVGDYFDREVLSALPAADVELLATMAMCQRISGPLCADVLRAVDDGPALSARLARLEAGGFVLARTDDAGDETWYRIHPLLREVLLARLAGVPEAVVQERHGAACAWFRAHGMLDDAVHHAVQAGDVDAAACMVEDCAYDLLVKGELSRLVGLLRRLPLAELRARFGLLLVSAYYAMYTCQFDVAHESLARIAARRKALDGRQRYAEALVRAGLALQQDDLDTVLAMVPILRDGIPPEADDFSWNCRSNILGWAYVYQGQYDQARAVVEEAAARGAGTRSRLLGDCLTAMSLTVEGRLGEAERAVRETLEASGARGAAAIGLSSMSAGLLADILYEVNDTEAAVALLEPRMNVLERASLPDTVLHACRVLSRAHWLAGRLSQAIAAIDRLESYAGRFGIDRLLVEAYAMRLHCHHALGETQGANTTLRQLDAIGRRHADEATETARRVQSVVRQAHDDVLFQTCDFDAFVARATRKPERASLHPMHAASLELRLALAQHRLGRPQPARDHLRRALVIGHQLGLVRTLLDVSPDLFGQVGALLDAAPLDPVLDFYVKRLRAEDAGAPSRAAAQPGAEAIDQLSEREREVLELVAQAMPNKKIAVVLNLAPETIKWHLKNIYAKLGVSGRGGAAARLRDLAAARPRARR